MCHVSLKTMSISLRLYLLFGYCFTRRIYIDGTKSFSRQSLVVYRRRQRPFTISLNEYVLMEPNPSWLSRVTYRRRQRPFTISLNDYVLMEPNPSWLSRVTYRRRRRPSHSASWNPSTGPTSSPSPTSWRQVLYTDSKNT